MKGFANNLVHVLVGVLGGLVNDALTWRRLEIWLRRTDTPCLHTNRCNATRDRSQCLFYSANELLSFSFVFSFSTACSLSALPFTIYRH